MPVFVEGTLVAESTLRDGQVRQDGDLTIEISAFNHEINGEKRRFSGVTSQDVTDNAANYIFLNTAGTLVINTTGFPAATDSHIRLAKVFTTGSVITTIVDHRHFFTATSSSIGENLWVSTTNDVIFTTGSVEVTGSLLVKSGISGSHHKLADGTDAFLAGENITLSTASNGAVEIASISSFFFSNITDVVEQSGSIKVSGSGLFKSGLTGALNVLPDSSPYLLAGSKISLSTGSSGQITIASTAEDTYWKSITDEITFNTGSIQVTGSGLFKGGLSGSLTTLDTGASYLLAGPNITLATNSLGQIAVSSSAVFWQSTTNNQIFATGSAEMTGSLLIKSGISGSHHKLSDASDAFIAGPNIVLSTSSLGAVIISGSSAFFFSNTANIVEQSGSFRVSGSGLFKSGLTGALNVLPDGSPYLIAGSKIALSTGSSGQITIASTAEDTYWKSTSNNIIFTTGSAELTGSLLVKSGISGSHHKLSTGGDAFQSGPNITLATASNGAIIISGSATYWQSTTNNIIFTTGSLQVTGSGLYKSGLTGALNVLPDGSSYLLAGSNVTLSTGSNGAVTINSTGGAGTTVKHLQAWTANNAIFVSNNTPGAKARTGHAVIAFDDTLNEAIIFEGVIPQYYSGGSVKLLLHWVAASATSGSVVWFGRFERLDANSQNIDSDGFALEQGVTSSTDATSGKITKSTINFTNPQADAIAAGDALRIRLGRSGSSSSDTMAGDAQLLRLILEEQ